jgi:hypothetical protein
VLSVLFCISASSPVSAQQVYKCWSKGSVMYSQQPCSKRIVNTNPAGAPVKANRKDVDLRRTEQNRAVARAMRPTAGESTEDFETRRRRARLLREDRDECARVETRMPVEQASLHNPDKEESAKAEAALGKSRKRFSELGC